MNLVKGVINLDWKKVVENFLEEMAFELSQKVIFVRREVVLKDKSQSDGAFMQGQVLWKRWSLRFMKDTAGGV